MLDIVSFGSALVDTFVYTGLREIKEKGKKLIAYNIGEKFLIKETEQFTGGGGTNTAVGFARMGLKTGIITKVGKDSVGETITKELKKEKVSFLGKKCNGQSAFSIVLDSYEHDRTILTYKSVSDNITMNDFKLPNTRWIYFSSLMKESHKTQEKLAAIARHRKIKVAYNPSSYQTSKGRKYLSSMLKNTNILIFNIDEARMISQKKDIQSLMKDIARLGPEIICITDGAKMVYVYDGNMLYSAVPHSIKPKERTGAGDAFASGFVSAYIKKGDIPLAIKIGITNSESVILYRGAKNKLLNYHEALSILNKRPISIKKEVIKA